MTDQHDGPDVATRVRADLIEASANAYVIQADDGSVATVPKSPLNEVIFETDVLDGVIPDTDAVIDGLEKPADTVTFSGVTDMNESDTFGFDELQVTAEFDTETGGVSVSINDLEPVTLSATEKSSFFRALVENEDDVEGRGTQLAVRSGLTTLLADLYESAIDDRVRTDIIEKFVDQLTGVEQADDGWIIEDSIIVTYDGENYLLDDVDAFSVNGGSVAPFDGEPQLVRVRSRIEGHRATDDPEADDPDADQLFLTPSEQEFLGLVELLNRPERYVGVETFQAQVYGAIRRAKDDHYALGEELADQLEVTQFMDPQSGLVHHHGLDKHTLTSTFSVRPWVVEEMEYTEWDHAGVHELSEMEDYLRGHDRDVFYDTFNDDQERWEDINSTATQSTAPIPQHAQDRIRARWG